jgi:murein DD-endopeptidase MepM/ murein hydrolase activator NlpD
VKERVHLVVERSDGVRLARVPAPRWLLSAAVAVAGLGLVVLGAAWGDYTALKRQRAAFAALEARAAEQQRLLEAFQQGVARVRGEVDGWRDLHARIWEPFGPEGGPAPRGAGVGGGTALRLVEPAPAPEAASLLEELEQLAAVVHEEGQNLRALERFMARAGRALGALPSRWPVRGPVNSEFGRRTSPWSGSAGEFHSGLDIGAARGTPVLAPAPGTVVLATRHPEYGVTLVLDHGNDVKTLYGHLQKILVPLGQRVERGQAVALSGNTGRSSGPHLHYEIQVGGQPVDPRRFIWDAPEGVPAHRVASAPPRRSAR